MHNRRKFLTQSSLAIGAFTFLKPLQSIAGSPGFSSETNKLTILFTNGFDSHVSTDFTDSSLNAVKETVNDLRRLHRNILLVDSGNILAGNSPKNRGHLDRFASVKEAGYDAITPGKTDMQHGADYFTKLVERTRVNVVATNYGNQESLFSCKVVRKGALKVGIIGIGSTNDLTPGNFAKLAISVTEKAGKLKQKNGCQLVVCLSHLPLSNEQNKLDNLHLSKQSADVDVVISANDDRFIYNTHIVKNRSGNDVLLSHAGKSGSMVGKLEISFNEKGEKTLITTEQVFTRKEEVNALTRFRKHFEKQIA